MNGSRTADCEVQERDDPNLRKHLPYFCVKDMGVKHPDAQGQKMKLSKKAEVQNSSEFGEAASCPLI